MSNIYIPSRLRQVADEARAGKRTEISSVKELLSWYAATRRSPHIVEKIRQGLKELAILTDPDFEGAFLETPLRITSSPNGEAAGAPGGTSTAIADNSERATASDLSTAAEAAVDPTYRISRLEAANAKPLAVRPDASLETAITLMIRHDYSQLPVMSSDRTISGVISWQSIGCALALGKQCKVVSDCLLPHQELREDTSLFAAIDTIIDFGYVIIRDRTGLVTGIVTSSDLSLQFRQLAEPFLLIAEIENYLRKLIDDRCEKSRVVAARNPKDQGREIAGAADLTFGEYVRLLEDQSIWPSLHLNIDRKQFINLLSDIRRIRNDVMHFDPDGIAPNDEKLIKDTVHVLQTLAHFGAL